jgi:hypothetical protein
VKKTERILHETQEAGISLRGRSRYAVVDIARYDPLREFEIAAAWAQTREVVAAGHYRREGADAHIARASALTG